MRSMSWARVFLAVTAMPVLAQQTSIPACAHRSGGRRMPGRAWSATTVSWTIRLAPAPRSPDVACFCFDWVHGDDFGTSCSTTHGDCEAEAEASMRDRTECRSAGTRPRCGDEAVIDGARTERP